jgi:hypothetical protein
MTTEFVTDLVTRATDIPARNEDVRLQHLWLSLLPHSWRSLAVLGASSGVPTIEVANSLAHIAWTYTGQPCVVFDMRDLTLRGLEQQVRDMGAQLRGGERVFIALRSLAENPTASPLAIASDAVVLCVQLGKTDIKNARKTVERVGRERFLGSLVVSPDGTPASIAATE